MKSACNINKSFNIIVCKEDTKRLLKIVNKTERKNVAKQKTNEE